MKSTNGGVALGLIVLLGAILRFAWLDHGLFWHDEVYTTFFASGYDAHEWKPQLFTGAVLDVAEVLAFQTPNPDKGIADTVLGLARDEPQHPPLYYVLLRAWVGLFGGGVGPMRALTAVTSLFALPAIHWLCRELFEQRRVAWVATALLCTSPFFVLYAREAREYTLWSVLTLLSCAALLHASRRSRDAPLQWGPWALFSLLTTASLYTAFSAVWVIAGQVAWVVVSERGVPNRVSLSAAASMAVSALLFAPWAWMLWQHWEAFQASMAWSRTIVIPHSELFSTLLLNLSRPFVDFWTELDTPLAWLGVLAALALVGGSLFELRRAQGRSRWLLILLMAMPIAFLFVPDVLFGGIRSISTRYLTPTLLGLVIVVAHAVASRPALAMVVLGVAFASSVFDVSLEAPWTKGISRTLPAVADLVNAAERPLVVGNMEQHHPGNLLALCHRLKPGTKLQFLDHGIGYETPYVVPEGFTDVFLYAPIPPFVGEPHPVPSDELYRDLHLSLWRVR